MSSSLSRRHFALAAAAAGAAAALPGPALAQAKLKYGNAGAAGTLSNKFAALWFQEVAKRTNNAYAVDIFAGTLGGEAQLLQGMALGTLDIYLGAYTGTREFDIMYSPFFFRDGAHAGKVMTSPFRATAGKVMEDKYKAHFVGVGRLGPWCLFTKRPIASLADIKGMKIRAPQFEGNIRSLQHLGANPTPIAFNEIYTALQSGVVDGMVTSLNVAVAGKFFEVCKYVVEGEFGYGLDKACIASRVWSRLPADHQRAFQSAFDEKEDSDYYQAGIASVPTDYATWREKNGADSVIKLDLKAAAGAMESLNAKMADEVFGPGSWKKIQDVA
ncbi:MAG: hypothetical protein OHK0024_01430 [Thalassobaculales bacterium]